MTHIWPNFSPNFPHVCLTFAHYLPKVLGYGKSQVSSMLEFCSKMLNNCLLVKVFESYANPLKFLLGIIENWWEIGAMKDYYLYRVAVD